MDAAKLKSMIELEIFQNIKKSTIEQLCKDAFIVKLKKGEHLFYERDHVENIYIVVNGKITLYRCCDEGQKRVVFIIDKGKMINEVILDGKPASINCEAFEESEILGISRGEIMKAMTNDSEFMKNVVFSMSKKVRRLYRQLKNTVPIKIEKKVAAKLWKLAKDYGVEADEGTRLAIPITITYIADMLGSTRETISRSFKYLENLGLIKYKDKKIVILDTNKLSEFFKGV